MFAAALTIYLRPELAVLDPVCTFVFSALVLATTISYQVCCRVGDAP